MNRLYSPTDPRQSKKKDKQLNIGFPVIPVNNSSIFDIFFFCLSVLSFLQTGSVPGDVTTELERLRFIKTPAVCT